MLLLIRHFGYFNALEFNSERCNSLDKLKKHTYIYFSSFSASGKKYVASVKCTKSKCSRLLWQDQMLKRIKLTMNRTQLSYLLHFWIILIEPIFLFYAHIWIKYLRTSNLTHAYTNSSSLLKPIYLSWLLIKVYA